SNAEIRLHFKQYFGVERYRRDRVVDVVGDAAGHLPQRAQAFLLHHGLLRLAKVVVGLLERGVNLRLMGGEGDVFTELAQKFAVATRKTVGLPARRDQNSKDFAFRKQRRGDHRAQAAAGEALRKRKIELANVGLVDQTAAHTLGKPVLIDRDIGLLRHSQLHGQRFA